MRRKLVAGNWKMHGLKARCPKSTAIAAAAAADPGVDVALCRAVDADRAGGGVAAGHARSAAQDVPCGRQGRAYRLHFGGDAEGGGGVADASSAIANAARTRRDRRRGEGQGRGGAAARAARDPVRRRDAGPARRGQAEAVVTAQLAGSLPEGASADWLAIAYEPVWAIGTGRTPTEADVAAMHGAIRAKLRELLGGEAGRRCGCSMADR